MAAWDCGVLWECFVVHGQRNKAHKQLFISLSIFRLLQLLKHGCKSSKYPLGRNELQFQKMPLTCYKKNVQKEHCNSNTVAVWLHPRHFKALFEDAAWVGCELCKMAHQKDFQRSHAPVSWTLLQMTVEIIAFRYIVSRCYIVTDRNSKVHSNLYESVNYYHFINCVTL